MIVNFTFYVFFAYNVIWYGYIGHRDFFNYQDFLNRELQYTSVRYNTCSGISITPNTVVSNHVNSDHVPSFSCLDV